MTGSCTCGLWYTRKLLIQGTGFYTHTEETKLSSIKISLLDIYHQEMQQNIISCVIVNVPTFKVTGTRMSGCIESDYFIRGVKV
jgi:hypothetical protein